MGKEVLLSPLNITQHVTRLDLHAALACAFDESHPIHRTTDFVDQTVPFDVYKDGRFVRSVEVKTSTHDVASRLDTICNTLTLLSERTEMGNPAYSCGEVAEAYAVVAANWLSVHGCLGWGVRGHGRSLFRLYPIICEMGGHSEMFNSSMFTNQGVFDLKKAKVAVVLLDGHPMAGLRVWSAKNELDIRGEVPKELCNPAIIWDSEVRRQANRLTQTLLFEQFKKGELV